MLTNENIREFETSITNMILETENEDDRVELTKILTELKGEKK